MSSSINSIVPYLSSFKSGTQFFILLSIFCKGDKGNQGEVKEGKVLTSDNIRVLHSPCFNSGKKAEVNPNISMC